MCPLGTGWNMRGESKGTWEKSTNLTGPNPTALRMHTLPLSTSRFSGRPRKFFLPSAVSSSYSASCASVWMAVSPADLGGSVASSSQPLPWPSQGQAGLPVMQGVDE